MSFFDKLFNKQIKPETDNLKSSYSKFWDLYGVNVSPEIMGSITIESIKKDLPDFEILSKDKTRYEISRKDNYKVLFYVLKKGGLSYVIINGKADVYFLDLKAGSPIDTLIKLGWAKTESIYRSGIQATTFKKVGSNAEIQVRINDSDNSINEIHYILK